MPIRCSLQLVKPSISSIQDIRKFPGIPPHRQLVQYGGQHILTGRNEPPATVQQKDLVMLEYVSHKNVSITTSQLSEWPISHVSITYTAQRTREKDYFVIDQHNSTGSPNFVGYLWKHFKSLHASSV